MTDSKAVEPENKQEAEKKENALMKWWRTLTREEWELTVFFPGQAKILPDGTRLESGAPQTYRLKKIQKLTNTHIIFIDTQNRRHEIKVVNPVGYDLVKIY